VGPRVNPPRRSVHFAADGKVSTPCALRNRGEDRVEIAAEDDEASRTFVRSPTPNGATLKEAGQYIRSLSRIEELEIALDDGYSGLGGLDESEGRGDRTTLRLRPTRTYTTLTGRDLFQYVGSFRLGLSRLSMDWPATESGRPGVKQPSNPKQWATQP
jgi:hypothetical protein